jgi:hypothetical protein
MRAALAVVVVLAAVVAATADDDAKKQDRLWTGPRVSVETYPVLRLTPAPGEPSISGMVIPKCPDGYLLVARLDLTPVCARDIIEPVR